MDHFCCVTWVYLLRDKSKACERIVDFYCMLKTQFGTHIKRVRSDNGIEFTKGELKTYFLTHGMFHETSCVETP